VSETGSVFSRFIETPKQKQLAEETSPAQKLLNFLQRWPKDTISVREITLFGPSVIRAQRSEINTAEILVRHGWLTPIQSRQRNMRHWQVVRRPIVHPDVEL
jgi:hypothetical protein